MRRASSSGYVKSAVVRLGNGWATRWHRGVTLGPGAWLHPTSTVRVEGSSAVRLGAGTLIDAHTIVKADGDVTFGDRVWIEAGGYISAEDGQVVLGDRVYVGPGTVMYGKGGLTIGDDCLIGPQVVITAQAPRYDSAQLRLADQGYTAEGIVLGRDVGVGAHATIVDGVTIGDGACIVAGALVTRSIPPFGIVAGAPARVVGRRGHGTLGSPSRG